MNKKQYVDALKHHQDDVAFVRAVFVEAFSVLPTNYRNELIRRQYMKFVYDGTIVKCVQPNGGVMYFLSVKELMTWLRGLYPKANRSLIYETAKWNTANPFKRQKVAYRHVISYLTDKSEL